MLKQRNEYTYTTYLHIFISIWDDVNAAYWNKATSFNTIPELQSSVARPWNNLSITYSQLYFSDNKLVENCKIGLLATAIVIAIMQTNILYEKACNRTFTPTWNSNAAQTAKETGFYSWGTCIKSLKQIAKNKLFICKYKRFYIYCLLLLKSKYIL